MKYIITMKQGYDAFEFVFDDFLEGCQFMIAALKHSEGITFIVRQEGEAPNEG